MSISNKAGEWLQETIRSLEVGDTVDLSISSEDTRWNKVVDAVGAMHWILRDGIVDSSISDGTAAPRTAVGVKPDGSVIFYTIDGRQKGLSIGATIQMVAQRLKELGCQNAVLLDGGGSTTLVSTYPDYGTSSSVNSPSEGTPRSVSNAIFLVSNLKATGKAGSLYVTPKSLTLMPGASTQCVATAVDTGWWPMSSLPGAVTWSAAEGSVTTDGTFTAPQKAGVYTVTAESGGVKGSTNITVLQPTAIYVTNQATKKNVSTLTLAPGQSVDLAAAAAYRSVGLTGSDKCFTWTADEAIGSITQDGKFTAGPNTATGKIKVSSGSYAVTIAVSVSAPTRYTLLDGFEGTTPGFTAKGGTVTLDTAQVKYGKQSLKLAYQDGASVALSSPRTLAETDRYVSLWVYGDQSGSIVSAAFAYADGTPITQSLTTLSFSGWKQVTAAVPENAKTFTGFSVAASKHGTTWLDQVVFSNEAQWDSTAPSVDLTVRGQAVTATTLDDISGSLTAKQISLTLDGQPVDFTWKANGTLSAALPALGTSSHQVSLTVSDACGNLARKSVTISGTAATRFADMQKHWASTYTPP